MRTEHSSQFFYLSDETQDELHDESYCSCPQPQSHPHSVVGAHLYELDTPGLQALDKSLMGDDERSFGQWRSSRPAKTYYGANKQAAIKEAIQQARKEGKLIINHPEAFPWIIPLVSVLAGVVGDGQLDNKGCLPEDSCKCNSVHAAIGMVCRACYGRLISKVIYTFIFAYLRQS